MKKPYSHRWVPKYFVRAVLFGVVFLAVLLVLNYLNQEKVKEYDMVFWNSFFTIAMTYCAYAAQIVYSDYKELNQDKAGNVRHIVHSVTKAFSPIAFSVVWTYVILQVATETTHYKEIAFALVVWGVCRVVCSLTKEKE